MNFSNVINKFINENAVIKRNRFQYQIVEINDSQNKKIVLITAFLNDNRIEKFWQEYNEAIFTIDDTIATDWEFVET
jgi:hypothetical protein